MPEVLNSGFMQRLIVRNHDWAEHIEAQDPGFFRRLAEQQTPKLLWIGCSDSRVPATQIVDIEPGEIFVHRNVANVVVHTDLNCLSTIQFAVDVLKVEHVVVCGHYGCGGVKAALNNERHGLVDNWIQHVKDVRHIHSAVLDPLPSERRLNRLCELNALSQARHVCLTNIVQDAWSRGQKLSVHAWIYGLADGRINDLGFLADAADGVNTGFEKAVKELEAA